MSHSTSTITTYSCDATDCDSVMTFAGGNAPELIAEEKGWVIVIVGNNDYDLCPECKQKLGYIVK